MYDVINFSNTVLQLTITVFLWHQIAVPKFSYFKTTIILLAVSILHFFVSMTTTDTIDKLLRSLIIFSVPFIMYKDKILKKIVMVLLYFIPGVILEATVLKITLLIFGNDSDEFIIENHILPFGMMLLSDLMLICFIFISCIWRRKDMTFRKNITYLAVIVVFTAIHLGSMIFYYSDNTVIENDNNNLIQFIYQALLIILIFIQYYNMLSRQQLIKSEENMKRLEEEMKHIYNYYTLADEKFTEISGLRHDMQNQIAAVKHLISEEKNNIKAQEVIEQIQEKLSAAKKVQFCANPIINAVMTVKMNSIAEHKIDTDIILNDCGSLPFEDYDLCSLFANLFDNAFEACLKTNISGRFIEIKSGIKEKYFILKMRNSCNGNPITAPDRFPDTDKDEPGHGLGTKIIDAITKKYDGDFRLEYDNNIMTSTIILTIAAPIKS